MNEIMTTCCLPQPVKVEEETQATACPKPSGETAKKCMRPGRITNNGYLNFLREYREKNCNLSAVEIVKQGAKAWNALSCEEKFKYQNMGKGIRRTTKRKGRSMTRRSNCGLRSKSRSRSRSTSRSSYARKSASRCGGSSRSRSRSSSRCGSKRNRSSSGSRGRSRGVRKSRSARSQRRLSKSPSRRRRTNSGKSKRPRSRCARAGPITSNPYLNFLRTFRRCNCGLKQSEVIRRGARKWCSLSPEERKRYIKMACRVARSNYSRRKAICREARKKRSRCS